MSAAADPSAALARCALEALVEAEQLAAASPTDPVLREIVDDLEALFLDAFRAVLRATRRTKPCPGGCDHTDAEHDSFDRGVTAGEAGDEERPPPGVVDREGWLVGYTVGRRNAAPERRPS